MIRAVLFDLDGVVRHFDLGMASLLEQRHGLDPGAIESIAFGHALIQQVTTGQITRARWITAIGNLIGNAAAAQEWGRLPSHCDSSVLAIADELRAAGRTTAILTNGTDTVRNEVASLGLMKRFGRMFNSADIGYAKPDLRVFRHVLRELGLTGPEVYFVDDSAANLGGASELGMITHHFTGVAGLQRALTSRGITVRAPSDPSAET